MGICLSDELVEQYVTGNCPPEAQEAIEAHLTRCQDCQQRIKSARSSTNTSGRPDSATGHEEATIAVSSEVPTDQDERPTQSISEVTAVPYGKPAPTDSMESMFEGYRITEELPRGGQAVVYKAIHTATNTNVAIKVLLPTLLASQRARYYFEREAELIARLDHPNIVGIRDSGILHGQYYFVMQYIEGHPLLRHVRAQNLSFKERLLLFNKICSAITYAHQQGIIHRDLKFANILVDERSEPHILDFGLAKVVGLSESTGKEAVATMTGQWAGSLSTMSPEQAAGRPDLIDVRTDVYSLGAILYHMLIGQYPYDVTGSTLQVLQNIQKAEPIRPRQIIRKFDSDIEAILLTALAKEPAQRYQSAADLQSDIENWLQGRPIRVKSISTLYLLRKIVTRHRYTSAVAVLLLVIILGFAYTSFDLYLTTKKAQKASEIARAELTISYTTVVGLLRQMTFTAFLRAWEEGGGREANMAAASLSKGSKEKTAAVFLLDPRPVVEKEPYFRKALSDEHAWFVDFIIGENHRRNGDKKQALEAYRRSHEAVKQLSGTNLSAFDSQLTKRVLDRLDELTTTQNQDKAEPVSQLDPKMGTENIGPIEDGDSDK